MGKLFASMLGLASLLVVVLAAYLYLNRADTVDASREVTAAQIERDNIKFDADFDDAFGIARAPADKASAAQRQAELNQRIAKAEQQKRDAEAKRQATAAVLDQTLADFDAGKIPGPQSQGPSFLSVLAALILLAVIGLVLRALGRDGSSADKEGANGAVRFLDRVIDRAQAVISARKAGAAKAEEGGK